MSEGERVFRIAPHNAEKKSEDLDAMIVIPSYDEGLQVIDTIYSAVMQEKKKGNPAYGLTVVVNSRPDTAQRIKENNFNTYILLQALEHRFPLRLRGNAEFNKKVEEIQRSKMPIHVIDTFFGESASEKNNVGRARKVGTDFATSKIRDEGFVVSTDADTKLAPLLLRSTKLFFETTDYDAVELKMHRDIATVSEEEKRANAANSLYWDLRELSSVANSIEESLVWMSGGGSAFRKSSYKVVGSYREIPGEEDTFLGIDMADKGLKVVNARDPKMLVITKGRFSERASTGLGHSILKWAREKGPFHEVKMPSFKSVAETGAFFRNVETVYSISLMSWCKKKGLGREDFQKLESKLFLSNGRSDPNILEFLNDNEERERRSALYADVIQAFKIRSPEDKELLELLTSYTPNEPNTSVHHDLCKKAGKVFAAAYPDQTVKEFVDTLENATLEYESAKRKEEQKIGFTLRNEIQAQTYEAFRENIMNELREAGIETGNDETHTKVRISIIHAYRDYQNDIEIAVGGFTAQTEALAKLKSESDPATIEALSRVVFPRNMIELLLENGYWKAREAAIDHFRRSIVYEVPRTTQESLAQKATDLALQYREFLRDRFLPYMDEMKEANAKSLEIFKKFLKDRGELTEDE